MQCPICSVSFEPSDRRGRRLYCSRACKVKADGQLRMLRYREDPEYREKCLAWQRAHKPRTTQRPTKYYTPPPEYFEAQKARKRASARRLMGHADPHGERRVGPCESCGDHAEPLCLDHDHSTGAQRGWLCRKCNLALGYLKDDPLRILNLHSYITKAR